MTVILWWCPNPDCKTFLFKQPSPVCPGCQQEGERIMWTIPKT